MIRKDTITVSEFVNNVKTIVGDIPQFKNVAIVGELSNFTAHSSGHFYFSIKDEKASMRAVMFRSRSTLVNFKPKDGDKVLVVGRLDVYEASGQMQFYVDKMTLDGLGELYLEFEKLKKTLSEKGFFNEEHKKALPKYPSKIGVISGKGSAAHSDITRTLKERWPVATQIDYFSLVQGDSASADLINNLLKADNDDLDVIIIARGGGSIEDLWAFNNLELVMTIFNLKTPIVSGIGHEIDFTLSDFVSDYRAATPTFAAMAVTPDKDEVITTIRNYKNKMYLSLTNKIKLKKQDLFRINETKAFKYPETLLDVHYMKLDLLNMNLLNQTKVFQKTIKDIRSLESSMLSTLNLKLQKETLFIKQYDYKLNQGILKNINYTDKKLDEISKRNLLNLNKNLEQTQRRFLQSLKTLDHLSPLKIMSRGYSVVKKDDKVIKSKADVLINDEIQVILSDGTIHAKVTSNTEGNND